MFILRNAARTILLAALVLNSGLAARGDDKPLSMRDIARMRHQRLSPDKIVEKATEQGVSFAVTPGNEKQLGRLGFTPEQIDAIKEAAAPRAKAEGGEAGKPAAIVPGQGLKSSDAERDGTAELVAKITKLSAANVQPVASKHVTLWAAKDDQAAFMPDIKKIEMFLEGKCREPLRSGLDKRAAHLVLLKTRYDYEKWIKAMFELMPERFKLPDAPGGDADLKASILKWTGYYSQQFRRDLHGRAGGRVAAPPGGGRRGIHEFRAAGRAPAARSAIDRVCQRRRGSGDRLAAGHALQQQLSQRGPGPGQRPAGVAAPGAGADAPKKESGVRQLLNMDTTNLLLARNMPRPGPWLPCSPGSRRSSASCS